MNDKDMNQQFVDEFGKLSNEARNHTGYIGWATLVGFFLFPKIFNSLSSDTTTNFFSTWFLVGIALYVILNSISFMLVQRRLDRTAIIAIHSGIKKSVVEEELKTEQAKIGGHIIKAVITVLLFSSSMLEIMGYEMLQIRILAGLFIVIHAIFMAMLSWLYLKKIYQRGNLDMTDISVYPVKRKIDELGLNFRLSDDGEIEETPLYDFFGDEADHNQAEQ